jgi:hypothetical protein
MGLYGAYFAVWGLDPTGMYHSSEVELFEALAKTCDNCSDEDSSYCAPSRSRFIIDQICSRTHCIDQAKKISKSIWHTFSNVPFKDPIARVMLAMIPDNLFFESCGVDQTRRGYYCYEHAHGFEYAIQGVSSGLCFSTKIQHAFHNSYDGRLHAWLKVTNKCSKESVFLDDGFMSEFPGFFHFEPPIAGAYKTGVCDGSPVTPGQPTDGEGSHLCDPIDWYDHLGRRKGPLRRTHFPDGTWLDEDGRMHWGAGPKN